MDHDQDAMLSGLVKSQATRHAAPTGLGGRIHGVLLAEEAKKAEEAKVAAPAGSRRPAAAHVPAPASGWARWLGLAGPGQWLPVGVSFACGLLVTLAFVSPHTVTPGAQDLLAQEIVDSHVRSLMVAHLTDVPSSDQHTVKPWFTGKLDFSPPVYDLAQEGYALTGGRLDYVEQRAVAALVYQHRKHTINVFIWPAGDHASAPRAVASRQGYNMQAWQDGGMQFYAVSDVGADELGELGELIHARMGDRTRE